MKSLCWMLLAFLAGSISALAGSVQVTEQGTLVKDGFHNAFPSIVEFDGAWYMSHRRATGHRRRDGMIPVYQSKDKGRSWQEVAVFRKESFDLRDPRLAVVNKQLVVYAGFTFIEPDGSSRHGVFAFRSRDGKKFEEFKVTGLANSSFFWGCIPYKGGYVATAYRRINNDKEMQASLYRSQDGANWQMFVTFPAENGNEVSMATDKKGELHCVIRRGIPGDKPLYCQVSENGKITQNIELAEPLQGIMLYNIGDDFLLCARHWKWKNPQTFKGRLKVRNDMFIMDKTGKLTFQQTLRSAGDCSYSFCVPETNNEFYIVYYSQHDYMERFRKEKNANPLTDKRPADICFARVKYSSKK